MRTIVYVDAFNLYYGCLRGTPYKWLNVHALCRKLLPPNDIRHIKYFTARLTARPGDPGQPARQEAYLRALRADPVVEIIFGHFLANVVTLPRADHKGYERVIKTEEKGSDVNLATHLLRDAFRGDFEVAALVTNDSDLTEAVKIVTQEVGLRVGILSPVSHPRRRPSRELARFATFQKRIRLGVLRSSQLPDPVVALDGRIHKPASW